MYLNLIREEAGCLLLPIPTMVVILVEPHENFSEKA